LARYPIDPRGRRATCGLPDRSGRLDKLLPRPGARPIARGTLDPTRVVEVGELVAGDRPGRTAPDELTLYKSVGVAVQDGTAATLVLAAARARGAGREVEL